jgi:uncharacterized membrane protein YfcA
MTDPTLLAALAMIFLFAGTIKGTVGVGLPTTALALMTLTLDPRTAIAVILFPMIFANGWQVYRSGQVLAAVARYRRFAAALAVGVVISVTVSGNVSEQALLAALGVSILIFVGVTASNWAPSIPDARVNPAQYTLGGLGGLMGGLTAVWVPALAIYLTARNVPKHEFVRASGLLIFIGSLPLAAGLFRQGVLTGPIAMVSVGLLVPTFVGFSIGEALRGKLSETGFRRLVLIFFALMGLNLIRRSFG